MNAYDNIDYSDYTLKQLYEARSGVDNKKYPNNAAQIEHYIKIKEGKIAEDSKPPERTIVEQSSKPVDSPTQIYQRPDPVPTMREVNKFTPIDLTFSDIYKTVLSYFKTNKTKIFERLKYPGIGVLLVGYLQMLPPEEITSISFWAVAILNLYVLTVLTVKCHRMVLLDEHVNGIKNSLIWGKRETSFLLNEISIGALSFLPVIVLIFLSVFIIMEFTDSKTLVPIYSVILAALGGYLFSRMVLVLPAVAADQNKNFSSWQTSKIYVWKIFVFVVFIPSILSLLATKCSDLVPYFFIVAPIVNLFTVMLAIISLSIIYKEITKIKET